MLREDMESYVEARDGGDELEEERCVNERYVKEQFVEVRHV